MKFILCSNCLFCLSINIILTVLPQVKTKNTRKQKTPHPYSHLFATSRRVDTEIVLPEEKTAVTELRLLKSEAL